MAPKDESPSASSTFLPLAKQLRRASVTSITSLFDKQSLNQTLDQIHTSASQSQTLTTFNDYTSPPPPSAVQKKAPDSAGGIGSWYSRMTSSVTSTKSNKSTEPVSRVSTARSGEAPAASSSQNGASSVRDRASTTNSAASKDAMAESHASLRAPSRISQYSQTADTRSVTGSVDGKAQAEAAKPATQMASHKPGHSISSQMSTSQVSTYSANEFKNEPKPTPASLKRAMTPDPSAPASPMLQDLERSRASLSLLPGKSISRTPSVSSSTSTRRIAPIDSRRDSARPAQTGPEISPTLSRFSSVPDVNMDVENGKPSQTAKDSDEKQVLDSKVQERPGLPRVSTSDAAEELRRIQAQGLGSAASNRAQIQTVGATLTQLKNKVLSRQYWMKDENAKDCFYCGDPFSTFRRKHHCRTCGQIFDAKCTTLISGNMFGQSGNIRVCKPCEGLINGYDDSSDYTDDDTASIMTARTKYRHGSKGAGDTSPIRPSTPGSKMGDSAVRSTRSNLNSFKSHLPSVIGRRVIDDLKRTSGQYDEDSDRRSIRPASSRSMKSSHGMRPHTGHRRYHSKHLLNRNSRNIPEEQVPFYRGSDASSITNDRLPAFHSDNVIDPDLAAYLSDDGESEEEEQSLAAALAGSVKGRIDDQTTNALKRPRSKYGDSLKIVTNSQPDTDSMSVSSSKVATPLRHFRRRNVSFTGSALQNSPPKPQRLSVAAHQWSSPSLDGLASSFPSRADSVHMTRSISMQGPRAPPVELNNASLQHGKRLLKQMLVESSIANVEKWEEALMPILLRATDDVVPNVQAGDAINITNYVKLKKITGGKPGDTTYISGVVFSKNVALKSMKRNVLNPNILIITFALEYSRHETHFMSLEPVIRQEREYLQNLVNRIAALKPELLLVQRNVSGLALEMLDKAKIATAYNVKRSVLEAISRCCQTRIITSLDKLANQLDSHSACESFYLKTFLQETRRKTYMFLSGCPRELGCTIVLRGGGTSDLRRVKRVAEFMLQAIYNLRLETSLMRDEFALIPRYGAEGTIRYEAHLISKHEVTLPVNTDGSRPTTSTDDADGLSIVIPDKRASSSLGIAPTATEEAAKEALRSRTPVPGGQPELPDDIPAPTFYSDLVEKQRTRILSTSPFVKFMQPYLLMRARESERRLMHLKRLLDQDMHDLSLLDDSKPKKFSLITPEMINETVQVQGTSRKIREIIHAVHESEYDKATHTYKTQTKQWQASVSSNADMFNPLSHQSITVLHSLISTSTSIACSGPDAFTIRFYDDRGSEDGPEADCTLGQYVEDTCLSAGEACHIHGCNRKMYEHHRHYVHGEGRLEVTIERLPPKAPGLDEIPLMWSACRVCKNETQPVPISTNTWNYSFGKYLELAFWSIPLKPRADICPHDLHHDHWRYFGYRNWAIRLQYDPIDILEVLVPRTRITWNVVNDLKFKNENFRKAERRLNKFVASVKARLDSIKLDTLLPEKVDECKEELHRLRQLIAEDQQKVLEKLQEKYEGSKFYEIVPFNRALRLLHEKAGEWDVVFADFADAFLPSEKDIKRLATIQVKKLLFGTEETGSSLISPEDTTNTSFTDDAKDDHSPDGALDSTTENQMISEKAHDAVTAVVEEGARDAQRSIDQVHSEKQAAAAEQTEVKAVADPDDPLVHHLDLAVSSPTSPKAVSKSAVSPIEDVAKPASDGDLSRPVELSTAADAASEGAALTPIMSEENQDEAETPNPSGIPQPAEHSRRKSNGVSNVPAQRSQSQPAHLRQLSTGEARVTGGSILTPVSPTTAINPANQEASDPVKPQRRLSQRFAGLRTGGQSKIPRLANSNRRDNKVLVLAKHFEQLISREFQQERLRDKKKRAGRQRQAGAYPAAALKPVVEVYHDVREAVGGGSAESLQAKQEDDEQEQEQDHTELRRASTAEGLVADQVNVTDGDGFHAPGSKAQQDDLTAAQLDGVSATKDDANNEAAKANDKPQSPTQRSFDDTEASDEPPVDEDVDDLDIEVTRHEKTSIMKMITNFWAERSASNWEALYYPLRDIDHVFANTDIVVREDEPSSLIALALDHEGYREQLKSLEEISNKKSPVSNRPYVDDLFLSVDEQRSIERSLLEFTGHHLDYAFERGPAKMQCKIFWAEQFEAVRKKCGVSERIVESLSRCLKWDSQGGKSKSIFLRTLDDRFVLKSLSQSETRAFTTFASTYFDLMGEALFHELPSLIAKMLGFYYVKIQDSSSGIYFDEYLLLMENLFYARAPNPLFDLKGAMRNRKKNPSGEQNEVLLDENMVDYIAENPLFAREHSKKLLRSSIYNDTLFLAKQNVMDYSLMLGIDGDKRELVVGIIDCIRKYTWDKKLETWVKDRGKNRPTVMEPKDYKNRFREAINRYVLQTPDCWHFGLAANLGYPNARTEIQMAEKEDDLAATEGKKEEGSSVEEIS